MRRGGSPSATILLSRSLGEAAVRRARGARAGRSVTTRVIAPALAVGADPAARATRFRLAGARPDISCTCAGFGSSAWVLAVCSTSARGGTKATATAPAGAVLRRVRASILCVLPRRRGSSAILASFVPAPQVSHTRVGPVRLCPGASASPPRQRQCTRRRKPRSTHSTVTSADVPAGAIVTQEAEWLAYPCPEWRSRSSSSSASTPRPLRPLR
jgi:hypothetical protein